MLTEYEADPDLVDDNYQSALELAQEHGHSDMIHYLSTLTRSGLNFK